MERDLALRKGNHDFQVPIYLTPFAAAESLLQKVPIETVRAITKKAIQEKLDVVSKDIARRVQEHKRLLEDTQLQHSLKN